MGNLKSFLYLCPLSIFASGIFSLSAFANDANSLGVGTSGFSLVDMLPAKTIAPSSYSDKPKGKLVFPSVDEIEASLPKANIADKSIPRLDASSSVKLQESFANMLLSITNDTAQQAFAGAMATIGLALGQNTELDGNAALMRLLNGRSADEIVLIARKLTPQIKSGRKTLDGSSVEKFGSSVGQVLIGLPLERQGDFSEAIAKLMYDAKRKGESEASIAKILDGKTAEEVIAIAAKVDMPFDISSKSPKNFEVSSPTEKELVDFNVRKAPPKDVDYKPSLVPSANIGE